MGNCWGSCCIQACGCQVVQESTIVPLQRFGKFTEFMEAGCACTDCCTVQGPPVSLRLRTTQVTFSQLRTKDNVFVTIDLAIQWRVNGDPSVFPKYEGEMDEHGDGGGGDGDRPVARNMAREELLYAAVYRTQQQIKDNAEQFFRIQIASTEMDSLFNLGLSITRQCQQVLNLAMNHYGYIVKKVVIRDISPEPSVRKAMNDIVVSEKSRIAIYTKADAAKAVQIKDAEADAEVSRLQGEGVAKQRSALMNGIKKSVEIFDSEPSQIMSMLMMTQYTDMVKESIDKAGAVTITLNAAPTAAIHLENQIKQCIKHTQSETMSEDELNEKVKRLDATRARERKPLLVHLDDDEPEQKSTKKRNPKSGKELMVKLDKDEI